MLRHLFKLIWNKKRENFLLIIEITVSFLVIFAVLSMAFYYQKNYARERGFEPKNTLLVTYTNPWKEVQSDSLNGYFELLKSQMQTNPAVKKISLLAGNYPYSNYSLLSEVSQNNYSAQAIENIVDENYAPVLSISLMKGRWFLPEDQKAARPQVVITRSLESALFGQQGAVGAMLSIRNKPAQVIGVIPDIKDEGDYKGITNKYFVLPDSSARRTGTQVMLLLVAKEEDANAEAALFRSLRTVIRDGDIQILHLNDLRKAQNRTLLLPVMILLVIAGFLIFNVGLGLFGILWFNISKRKSEIAVRMALGAAPQAVTRQMVLEALIISIFGLIIGSFFALQFPLLNVFNLDSVIYLKAYLLAALFIGLLVVICALYPARQAARLYPATILHED